jgi:hypothetical protein
MFCIIIGNMDKKQLGKNKLKGNATQKMPNVKKAVSAGKDALDAKLVAAQAVKAPAPKAAADKLKLTQVEPEVPLKETLKSAWNKTAHVVTVLKNIVWKAVIPVAVADYAIQTINACQHTTKGLIVGISTGFNAVMQQIKPIVAWGAGHTLGVVLIVVGYIALNRALKFRFHTASANESAAEQK